MTVIRRRKRRGKEAASVATEQGKGSSAAATTTPSSSTQAATSTIVKVTEAERTPHERQSTSSIEFTSTSSEEHDPAMPSDEEIAALKKDSDKIRKSLTSFFRQLRDYKSSEIIPSVRLRFMFFTRRLAILTEIHSLVFYAARIKASEPVDEEWLSKARTSAYELSNRLDSYNSTIESFNMNNYSYSDTTDKKIKKGIAPNPGEWAEINSTDIDVIDRNKAFPIRNWEDVEGDPSKKEKLINAAFAKMIWTNIRQGFEIYNMVQAEFGKDVSEWLTEKDKPTEEELDKWFNYYYQEVWFLK